MLILFSLLGSYAMSVGVISCFLEEIKMTDIAKSTLSELVWREAFLMYDRCMLESRWMALLGDCQF